MVITWKTMLFGVILLVFVGFVIWDLICAAKYSRLLKRESDTVKVGRDTKNAKTWIILSAVWILLGVWRITDGVTELKKVNNGYYDSAYHIGNDSAAAADELHETLSKKTREEICIGILHCVMWSTTLILNIYEMKNGKFVYIADRGVYFSGSFLPSEKLSYEIKDGTVLLHRKGFKQPMRYEIIGEKAPLTKMLETNYKPYYDKYDT